MRELIVGEREWAILNEIGHSRSQDNSRLKARLTISVSLETESKAVFSAIDSVPFFELWSSTLSS